MFILFVCVDGEVDLVMVLTGVLINDLSSGFKDGLGDCGLLAFDKLDAFKFMLWAMPRNALMVISLAEVQQARLATKKHRHTDHCDQEQ